MEAIPTLYTALAAAFAKQGSGALIRFARRFAGERIGLQLEKIASVSGQIERFATELTDNGLVSEPLFEALINSDPDNVRLIDAARTQWRAERDQTLPPPTGAPVSSAPAPTAEYDEDWWKAFDASLEAALAQAEDPPQTYIDAAALLPSFEPAALALLPADAEAAKNATVLMTPCTEPGPDGEWVLKREIRRDAIARMWIEGHFAEGLALARTLDHGNRHPLFLELLGEILDSGTVRIDIDAQPDRLVAARAIGDWFHRSGHSPVDLDRLAVVIEARERIEPLRKLVGKHFRGRDREMAILRELAGFGPDHKAILALTGNGGVGKSTIIAKYLLERIDRPASAREPVVYLDFDRLEIDPLDHLKLTEQIARSLGLLYVGSGRSLDFYAIESTSAGDILEEPLRQQVDEWIPTGRDARELLQAIGHRVALVASEPLVLIFDTFEQIAVRGPDVLHSFTLFASLVLEAIPGARIIISGRGRIALPLDMYAMPLGDLDEASADAVLAARGVTDPDLRKRVIEAMGRSPLSLHLAANALGTGKLKPEEVGLFAAGTQALRIQGMLYTRVLGYIGDGEVARLAHPGMVVRRVTPEVIRKVLAEVCDVDPGHADAIFARLPNYIDLFEPASNAHGDQARSALADPGALRHRQDLREAIIDIMLDDPHWKPTVRTIHDRAVAHYSGGTGAVDRAEEIYHRLMRGDDPAGIDSLWGTELAPSLARSWSEPFAPRAHAWLALRLGFDWSTDDGDLRLADWEARIAPVAERALATGNPQAALDAIAARAERTAASPLSVIEVRATAALGDARGAVDIAERVLSAAPDARPDYRLALHFAAADAALGASLSGDAVFHANAAHDLATTLHDNAAAIRALVLLARARPEPATVSALESLFVATPRRRLRLDETATASVVSAIGAESNAVLRKAAYTFGDRPDQTLLSNDPGSWHTLFEEVAAREGGNILLAHLAPRVGLSPGETDLQAFATGVVRHDRRGEALTSVLDAFGGDSAIRQSSLAMFREVDP